VALHGLDPPADGHASLHGGARRVLVAALRSSRGASFRLVSEIDSGRFEVCVSVPLVLEYEAALFRHTRSLGLSRRDVSDFLDYMCSVARRQPIFFLWRPQLRDPRDDMVLEAAVAARSWPSSVLRRSGRKNGPRRMASRSTHPRKALNKPLHLTAAGLSRSSRLLPLVTSQLHARPQMSGGSIR